MNWYRRREVILCRRWSSEVEDSEVGVGGDGGYQGGVGGAERCTVSAVSDGQRLYRVISRR
jgi:hypothetical protein